MVDKPIEIGSSVVLQKVAFDQILAELRAEGYQVIGPRVENDVIVYGELNRLEELPVGISSHQEAGSYRLSTGAHNRYFDATPGAQSWKKYFFPPRQVLYQANRQNGGWKLEPPAMGNEAALALIGVRPCELAAIAIQDRIFLRPDWRDPLYNARRQRAFILAVNCLHPSQTCFCTSMGTGPLATTGFDLSLTELEDVFLLTVGSEAGRMILAGLPTQPASAFLLAEARQRLGNARQQIKRAIPEPEALPKQLLANLEHPHWDQVAARCLSCASCTQVCPTCFCWDAEDHTNITRDRVERIRVWDSCFNPDYSYVAGGNTRPTTHSRYRQWLTHKLGSWQSQFETPGCVGCGRCITWCPAGIDITQEVAKLRQEVPA